MGQISEPKISSKPGRAYAFYKNDIAIALNRIINRIIYHKSRGKSRV